MAIFQESGALNNSVFGKSQEPIKMLIEAKEEAWQKQSVVEKVFAMNESNNFAEKYAGMTAMGGFKPTAEGGEYGRDDMQEGFSKVIENVTWKDAFEITQEMIEDSKTIDLRQRPTAFVNGYYRTREQFGAALLGSATAADKVTFSGTDFSTLCADGKNVFAIDHPTKVSGAVQSNKYTDAFSADALSYGEEKMQNFRGDNGDILGVSPDTIIIPNVAMLKKTVFAAIGADKDPATANNGFNFQFGRWNVIVWSYLNQYVTATAGVYPWFLLDSTWNEENAGAIWQDRIKLTIKSTIEDNNDNNVWRGRARFNAGFGDFRALLAGGCAAGSTFTA